MDGSIEKYYDTLRRMGGRCISNCYINGDEIYGSMEEAVYFEYKPDKSLIWYICERDYFRMYFLISEGRSLDIEKLPDRVCVCNMITTEKRNPTDIMDELQQSGFAFHARWNKWIARKADFVTEEHPQRNDYKITYEFDHRICDILNENFDTYSERLPDETEYEIFMGERDCITAYQKDKIAGFLVYWKPGNFAEVNYVYVDPQFRGLKLGNMLMNEMFVINRDSINRCNAWISDGNVSSESLHGHFGFKITDTRNIVFVKEERKQDGRESLTDTCRNDR